MKRIFNTLTMMIMTMAVLSCAKENLQPASPSGSNPEGIRFTARIDNGSGPGSKVDIVIDGSSAAKVEWTAGDAITIFDGSKREEIVLTEADINSDGSATVNAKTLSAGAERYIAFAGDKAGIISNMYNDKFMTNDVYTEIEAGRIPHAAYAVCLSEEGTEPTLVFKPALTLIRCSIRQKGVDYLTFEDPNQPKLMGCIQRWCTTANATSLISPDESSSVVKSHVDEDGVCYFAVRPSVNMANGFIIKAYDAEGSLVAHVSGKKAIVTGEGKLFDLGELDGRISLYDTYVAGGDIHVGSNVYNKVNAPNALLVSNDGTIIYKATYDTYDLVFVKSGITVTLNSNTFTKSPVIIGDIPGARPALVLNNASPFVFTGSDTDVAVRNMTVSVSTSANVFKTVYSSTAGASGKMIFDDCFLNVETPFARLPWNELGAMGGFEILNSELCVKTDASTVAMLIDTWNNNGAPLGDIVFKNNVVWSPDGTTKQFNVVSTTHSGYMPAGAITFENNIFYDIASDASAFTKSVISVKDLASASVKNNLCYSSTASTSRLGLLYAANGKSADEIAAVSQSESNWIFNTFNQTVFYGLVSGSGSWNYTGRVSGSENPFESFDAATGKYVLKAEYEKYGPER